MKVDAILLRAILGCHSKTPIEFMFLETGTISLNFILAQRRFVNFMKFYTEIQRKHYSKCIWLKSIILSKEISTY